jgi:hypothetical protein
VTWQSACFFSYNIEGKHDHRGGATQGQISRIFHRAAVIALGRGSVSITCTEYHRLNSDFGAHL